MPKKVLYIDVETTGLNPVKNDIIQIAGIIEIDGQEVDTFNYNMQPFSYENVEQKAIDVHGITIERMKTFPPPNFAYKMLSEKLGRYCNKFDRNDKFLVIGYNVNFDMRFFQEYWKKCKDVYLYSWIAPYPIDVYQLCTTLHHLGAIPKLTNYKLESMSEYFKIDLKAHDAMADIQATRELLLRIRENIVCQFIEHY